MRLSLRFFSRLAALYSKFSLEIPELARDLHVVDELRAQDVLPVFQLLAHLFDVNFGQFIVQFK